MLLQALHGHHGYVHHAVFSPDGQTVLTCSADKTARLWNIERGGFLRVFRGHGATVNTAVLSVDETRVLTASYDETARLWDAASGALLQVFKGHTNSVTSAAISPDIGAPHPGRRSARSGCGTRQAASRSRCCRT